METKQVIVIRKDLNMRRGKQIAQGAHASMKVLLDRGNFVAAINKHSYMMALTEEMHVWVAGLFTKVVVGVDSEEKLLNIHEMAKEANVPTSLIMDAGLTEFKEPTYTAVAVGPAKNEDVDRITGDLKLL